VTDLVFALDSIPAIFAVTQDAFIVFTSNIFAILGLRSLYFALAGAIAYFRYLKVGLSLVLVFIGVKMLAMFWHWHIPITWSLGVVGAILAVSILASIIAGARERGGPESPGPDSGKREP
jgi:tellurite resistance protein TerC